MVMTTMPFSGAGAGRGRNGGDPRRGRAGGGRRTDAGRKERTWIAVAGVFVQIWSNVVVLDCVISVLAAARLQVATGIRSRNLRLSFLTINVVWLTTAFQRWRRWKSSAALTHDRVRPTLAHAWLVVRDACICVRTQDAAQKRK